MYKSQKTWKTYQKAEYGNTSYYVLWSLFFTVLYSLTYVMYG